MNCTYSRPTNLCRVEKNKGEPDPRKSSGPKTTRVVIALLAVVLCVFTLSFASGDASASPARGVADRKGEASVTPLPGQDVGSAASDPTGPDSPTGVQVLLSPRETMLGPTWKLDTPFNTTGSTPNVIGYVSNTISWAYATADLFNLVLLPGTALTPGTPGSFDGCGAWLNRTYPIDGIVRGWYHAEIHPVCGTSPARKSVGYAESYDGGRTFVKPNYPNNQVISAPARFTGNEEGSEGDFSLVRMGDYFYLYFVAARDSYKIHLARSLVSDGGKPGTWWKYYNGSFSEPGLGGESTAIAAGSVLGRAWVSYNATLGEFMGFSWSPTGFGISLSPDGINWRRVTGDILFTDHQFHGRGPGSGELIDYTSFIGIEGSSDVVGADMWLYYMQVPAGQPMVGDTRYLARQRLHIQEDGVCSLGDFNDVSAGSTFYPYVRCLMCRGVMGGYPDNTFRPNNNITRGQLAKTVSNAAGFTEDPGGQIFQDVPSDSPFYQWANRLANRGIMSGYPCGGPGEPCRSGNRPYFRVGTNASRGQITKIVAEAAGFNESPGSRLFQDVPSSNTFYNTVQRLANRGIMAGYPCGGPGEPCQSGNLPYFRPSSNATRGQVAKSVSKTFFPQCSQ